MFEIIIEPLLSAIINIAPQFFNRSRLKLECGFTDHPNKDGIGNFVVFWIKIINPSRNQIYFERIEAKDSKGEVFFPMILDDIADQEIPPQRNIVALIPCGHIINTTPKEISVVDATEKHHKLKGRKLSTAVAALKKEVARLENRGFTLHPRRK